MVRTKYEEADEEELNDIQQMIEWSKKVKENWEKLGAQELKHFTITDKFTFFKEGI